MQGNAVDPSLQTGFAVEVLHAAKHLEENVLSGVSRVGGIAHHAVHEPVDGALEFANQPGIGRFRAGFEIRDNCGFFRPCSD